VSYFDRGLPKFVPCMGSLLFSTGHQVWISHILETERSDSTHFPVRMPRRDIILFLFNNIDPFVCKKLAHFIYEAFQTRKHWLLVSLVIVIYWVFYFIYFYCCIVCNTIYVNGCNKCYVMLRYVTLRYVTLCYVMLCYGKLPATRGASNPGLTEPASMFGFYHMLFR
jgi:hypothetical protein